MPELYGRPVGRIALGRNVDRKVRHQLPGQGEDARVGDEDGVDADIAEVNEIFRKAFQIFICAGRY